MSCIKVAVLTALGLFLTGCWGTDPPDPQPASDLEEQSVSDDQLLALKEIADLMREGKTYIGIVADLDMKLETPTALRFKSIIEKAARDEMDFEKRMAELHFDEILSPESLSTYEGRQASISSIDKLGRLYNDHVFRGSESTLEAIQFLLDMGAELEYDHFEVLQLDLDVLSERLAAMVQAYGEIVVVCNQGRVAIEDGRLLFQDPALVSAYDQAVYDAKLADSEFNVEYQSVLSVRQKMIDQALNAAYEALKTPKSVTE